MPMDEHSRRTNVIIMMIRLVFSSGDEDNDEYDEDDYHNYRNSITQPFIHKIHHMRPANRTSYVPYIATPTNNLRERLMDDVDTPIRST